MDTHGARDQWMSVFVYEVDIRTEPALDRRAMTFTEIYLGEVTIADFRKNPRGELGTRTATLHREGILKLRSNWIYKEVLVKQQQLWEEAYSRSTVPTTWLN